MCGLVRMQEPMQKGTCTFCTLWGEVMAVRRVGGCVGTLHGTSGPQCPQCCILQAARREQQHTQGMDASRRGRRWHAGPAGGGSSASSEAGSEGEHESEGELEAEVEEEVEQEQPEVGEATGPVPSAGLVAALKHVVCNVFALG